MDMTRQITHEFLVSLILLPQTIMARFPSEICRDVDEFMLTTTNMLARLELYSTGYGGPSQILR